MKKNIKEHDNINIVDEETTIQVIKQKLSEHSFFFANFFNKLRTDKIYLISFLITIAFFGVNGTMKVKKADGYLYNKKQSENTNSNETTITPINEAEIEEIDVTDYVGIYSKEYKLDNIITFGETCSIDSYKYIYQVKKDGTIEKYFYNTCIGTINIYKDKFKYNNLNGARYIGTDKMNFIFKTNEIKELDGDSFKTDIEITSTQENKLIKELDISFYGNNIILNTNTNLILINKDKVSSPITDDYINEVDELENRFYKSKTEYQYNFIVFKNSVKELCENNVEELAEDYETYTIYSIRYDQSSEKFLEPKIVVTRTKSNTCKNYKNDLVILKE